MIWSQGRIVAEDSLRIGVRDRVFEHGIGLFETFRTWSGHATLLGRHLARMSKSAEALGLLIRPTDLPDERAVIDLIRAEGEVGDARLRITASGGEVGRPSTVWMTSAPLPGDGEAGGATIDHFWQVSTRDPLARHKTLNYWGKRLAHDEAVKWGCTESLSIDPYRRVWEGSRTNLFLASGQTLRTPRTEGPLLPGIFREVVLERATKAGLVVEQGVLTRSDCSEAGEAFLTNSVRGVMPIQRIRSRIYPSPGELTSFLRDDVLGWLHRGGVDR